MLAVLPYIRLCACTAVTVGEKPAPPPHAASRAPSGLPPPLRRLVPPRELLRRLALTLLMVCLARVGHYIPMPGAPSL